MISYAVNDAGTGGTLTVRDGANIAHIALEGQYTTAGFEGAYDQGSGTAVAYDTAHESENFDQLVLGATGDDILTGSSGRMNLPRRSCFMARIGLSAQVGEQGA